MAGGGCMGQGLWVFSRGRGGDMWQRLGTCGRGWGHVAGVGACGRGWICENMTNVKKSKDVGYE